MKRLLPIALLVVCTVTLSRPAVGQVTADDFLPPVLGGPVDVKQPDEVRITGDVVTAASAQDAVNAAVAENVRELAAGDTPEVGAKMVQFPSGLGFVARLSKRKAYVTAFVRAKKNLAEMLGGLTSAGKETIRESLLNINLPDEEMTNISTETQEALEQAVAMMLRGFVVYSVKDDEPQNMVLVSIVTTPKTRGQLARPAPNVIEVDDLRKGLDEVIAEVRSGLVPPVGGRIIAMRPTGETAFVGFGSSIVRTSTRPAVQAKLNLSAQQIAKMRAQDALCGLIIGDRAAWRGSVIESQKDIVREFESLKRDDPLAREDPTAVRKLDQAREQFVSRMEATDVYRSARRGILPPGVNTKTWFDGNHAWAYGMSIYVPSLANVAAGAAREMEESRILQPLQRIGEAGDTAAEAAADEAEMTVSQPGDEVREGPTGKVSDDQDL